MSETWSDRAAHAIDPRVKEFVAANAAPGAIVVLGDAERTHTVAYGTVEPHRAAVLPTAAVRYDLASLTKVVATWPLVGKAVAAGQLDLDAPVGGYFDLPALPGSVVTTRQILSHTSGLQASTRFDRYVGPGPDLVERLLSEPLQTVAGTEHRYINRGFILLGLLLERLSGQPLDVLAEQLWRQLGMDATCYGPVPADVTVAPTEIRLPGTRPAWGVVHDENAALMGGVAGHAGVFSTAHDLARYSRCLLGVEQVDPGLAAFLGQSARPHVTDADGSRGLAWLLAADNEVVYHHGFTGTSLFLSLAHRRFAVLLSNAVYSSRERHGVAGLRAELLREVVSP
ncbi:hypothetical protein GCM10010174_59080 [Kutzneria viridogrisea]|uniref:CubicO group peptidase (Beta-lactamase class C family) n=1 Tax=Kutzneria viridogrisea TaxID=47990 RepID=A0ABR6BL16_9PSEU|nr:CubicO group peptidase (beta-lactamase class C family) [Kutzneria viridogrisea]